MDDLLEEVRQLRREAAVLKSVVDTLLVVTSGAYCKDDCETCVLNGYCFESEIYNQAN